MFLMSLIIYGNHSQGTKERRKRDGTSVVLSLGHSDPKKVCQTADFLID